MYIRLLFSVSMFGNVFNQCVFKDSFAFLQAHE